DLVARGAEGSALAGLALVFLLALGLRELPGRMRELNSSYRTDSRFTSFRQSESSVQRYWDVDAGFISYVSQHVPAGDSFYVSAGSSVTTDAPQRWFQFELLPSIEHYGPPCSAKWLVLYANPEPPEGVELGKLVTFK